MTAREYLDQVSATLAAIPQPELEQVLKVFEEARSQDRQVFVFGNGGSAMTASHIVCDFQKGLCGAGRQGLRALALTDSMALVSAWANDSSYDQVFSQQIQALGRPGDVALAISGSGNSPNVLQAVEAAARLGMVTIGMSGFGGGRLAGLVQHSLVVPNHNMQQVEDAHMVLCHLIFTHLMRCDEA